MSGRRKQEPERGGKPEPARPFLAVCVQAGRGGHRVRVLRLSEEELEVLSVETREPEVLPIALAVAQDLLADEATR